MSLFGGNVEKAADSLRRLQEARGKMEQADLADRAELAKLRAGQGDAEVTELLEGRPESTPGELGTPADRLRWEIQGLESRIAGRQSARPVLLAKLRDAIKAEASGRAGALRKDAARKQKELDAHNAKLAELRAALEQHAACPYMPDLRPIGKPGAIFQDGEGLVRVPRGRQLQMEADSLLAQADAIEQRAGQASAGDRIQGETLDALLLLASNDPLAPTDAAIRAWFDRATAAADAEWQQKLIGYAGYTPPGREVLYTLAWTPEGEIDLAHSSAVNREIRGYEAAAAGIAAMQERFQPNPQAFGAHSA